MEKDYVTIKVDNELNNFIKKALINRIIELINHRVMLGVKLFNEAQTEGKSLDDSLEIALDLVAGSNQDSWLAGFELFDESRSNGQSTEESLKRALSVAIFIPLDNTKKVEKSTKFLNNIVSKLISKIVSVKPKNKRGLFIFNLWQSIMLGFGTQKPEQNKNTEGGE